ncbi:MAG: DUF1552 domain-containing protein, partial [Planctomycetota bacterium]
MVPAFASADAAAKASSPAKRFVGVSLALGLHGPYLVPKKGGRDYEPSPYLKPLQDLRDDFTIISGASHPGVVGGHTAEASIFTACPNQRGATSRNTISVDQLMAKHLGHETRFPSLVLSTGREASPSYTENGSMIPAEDDPIALFAKLFVDDSEREQARQAELIRGGRSVMDVVGGEAKKLKRQLGRGDREKLDDWFTSVRELEKRLQENEAWVTRPKPKVDATPPRDIDRGDTISIERAMLGIVRLALATDSTRFVTLHLPGNARLKNLEGVEERYHTLSHHGKDEDKLDQLAIVEQAVLHEWGEFLRALKQGLVGDHTLLDETMVFLTSNLGNASSHDNRNMPMILAGGGFKHGQHLGFDKAKNYPLSNLYVSMLQRLGIETNRFSTGKSTL